MSRAKYLGYWLFGLACLGIMAFGVFACGQMEEAPKDRFLVTVEWHGGMVIYTIRDKQTGKCYLAGKDNSIIEVECTR